MRLSHATTIPGNTHAAHVANIKPTITGDALLDSQRQNEGGGPAGEGSASESTEEDSCFDVESLGLDLSNVDSDDFFFRRPKVLRPPP